MKSTRLIITGCMFLLLLILLWHKEYSVLFAHYPAFKVVSLISFGLVTAAYLVLFFYDEPYISNTYIWLFALALVFCLAWNMGWTSQFRLDASDHITTYPIPEK